MLVSVLRTIAYILEIKQHTEDLMLADLDVLDNFLFINIKTSHATILACASNSDEHVVSIVHARDARTFTTTQQSPKYVLVHLVSHALDAASSQTNVSRSAAVSGHMKEL